MMRFSVEARFELFIAGKFQFQVLHRAGHTVQEDQPENVADIMANFLIKHRLTIAKGSYNRISPIC